MGHAANTAIRTRPAPACYLCGAGGTPLYEGLTDRLFGAPGHWTVKRCTDGGCGLMWLDPEPLEQDLLKAYSNYYTHTAVDDPLGTAESSSPPRGLRARCRHAIKHSYLAARYGYGRGETSFWRHVLAHAMYLTPMRRERADANVFYLPSVSGGKLLEVGCGEGRALRYMRSLGWQVAGVDFDPASVELAKRHGLCVRHGEISEQRYGDDEFQAILMRHVIEHVYDPRALLGECLRILEPGGRLVLITPNARSWGHRLYGANWRGLEPPRHLHLFTPNALGRLVREAGFQPSMLRSSARSAKRMFSKSLVLARRNEAAVSEAGRLERATAILLHYLEWLQLGVRRWAGEELVMVAAKPGADRAARH